MYSNVVFDFTYLVCIDNDCGRMFSCVFFAGSTVFGRWKGLAMSVMFSLTILVGILVTCGCCVIPYLRGLLVKIMARAPNPERRDSMYLVNLEARQWAEE